jgi:uncharacterized protein
MRTSERLIMVCAVLVAGLAAQAPLHAQSGHADPLMERGVPANPLEVLPAPLPGAAAPVPLAPYSSVKDALRAGVRDYNSGDKMAAVKALEFAAGQGHLTAQWKLGRMYAAGDGVPHDDLKAFEYFSKIADENADETPGTSDGTIVATAFVALGNYFKDGIKGSYVKPSPARAFEMFHYAATYFRDSNAQFGLGRMYLDGWAASPRDPRQAARWLKLAAEKGHSSAQAVLGDILVRGDGVPRQTAEGLMWLAMAKDGADATEAGWITELHGRAFAQSGQSEKDAAAAYLQRHITRSK